MPTPATGPTSQQRRIRAVYRIQGRQAAQLVSPAMRIGSLNIHPLLYDFVCDEAVAGTKINPIALWQTFEAICTELGPRNEALITRRDQVQSRIDGWHKAARARGHYKVPNEIKALRQLGYITKPANFQPAVTDNVDPEIAATAGPQLVVPLDNARYALNAANARWGSLYDALYGTDVIADTGGCAPGGGYNPIRGDQVIAQGRAFLDSHFMLDCASHAWVTRYFVSGGALRADLGDGTVAALAQPDMFAGYRGDEANPSAVLLKKHGLHCEVRIDAEHSVGRRDHAGVFDIRLESAVTTIMDCEDSVCAVDADDKVHVYRNWLQLMLGTLTADFVRDGNRVHRKLRGDLDFVSPGGTPFTLPGRSLMLVRNVGPHLKTDIVTLDGEPIYETMLDALVTSLAGVHDLQGHGRVDVAPVRNSAAGSVYIVKPKMHGPQEVRLACNLFSRVEDALDLDRNTLKMGIMDEERRTSLNLAACIGEARHRVAFINTGFLDRTGDEIHTQMEAGAVPPKTEMKAAPWLLCYEDSNVDVGLASGLRGRAQIGKGMWAMPAEMAAMAKTKMQHPMAGASTAWVPSPTAATLHAMHYFTVDVAARQRALSKREPVTLEQLIQLPVMPEDRKLSPAVIQRELDNNVQGILGYVVRWVGQGIGCSTVSDIDDVGLMEDLATLRISSQHVANWLHHGLITEPQVRAALRRMANLVDQQNAGDPAYEPMAPNYEKSIPFQAAQTLVFAARTEPNGYTERILRAHRTAQKKAKPPTP